MQPTAEVNPEEIDWKKICELRSLKQAWPAPYWQSDYYQLVAKEDLIRAKRCILSMFKGGGKTGTILSLFEDPRVNQGIPNFTVLIFTNEKGMGAYVRDIKKFPDWEGKIQLVYGSKEERRQRWRPTDSRVRYFICSYDSFLSDTGSRTVRGEASESIVPKWVLSGAHVDGVVFDEFHRKFRRRDSNFWKLALKLFRYTPYCFPMSGSAVSKGPEDLWAALHLVDRKMWSTYWGYVYTWNYIDESGFGKTVLGPREDRVDKWRNAVRPYVTHVTAAMVGSSIPPLRRSFLEVELPRWQRKIHDDLLNESFANLTPTDQEDADPEFVFAENRLTALHKIRTALICPKALSPALPIGQGISDIWDNAQESELTRYNIFTPFRAPIPYLKEWLESQGARVWVLWGSIGYDEQERRLSDWRAYIKSEARPEAPGILLGTVKYGESWECPESSYGYFLGEEWDPEDDKQAESRLLRFVSPAPVSIQYCMFRGTYSEEILDLIITKGANARMMFNTWTKLRSFIMKHDPNLGSPN